VQKTEMKENIVQDVITFIAHNRHIKFGHH